MKIIFIAIIILVSQTISFAQSPYQNFREEMKKIETQEREYMDIVFNKNDYSKHYKDSVLQHLTELRKDKLAFARKSIDANRDDKNFVQVLSIYVQNFLTLDELEAELKKFTPEVQQSEEWKDKMDFIKY